MESLRAGQNTTMNVIPCSRLYHFSNGYSGGRKTRERGPGYLPFSSPLSAERERELTTGHRDSPKSVCTISFLAIYSSSQGQTLICVHVSRTHVVFTRVRQQIIASICSSEKPPEFYWDHVLDCALATYLSSSPPLTTSLMIDIYPYLPGFIRNSDRKWRGFG